MRRLAAVLLVAALLLVSVAFLAAASGPAADPSTIRPSETPGEVRR